MISHRRPRRWRRHHTALALITCATATWWHGAANLSWPTVTAAIVIAAVAVALTLPEEP